MTAEQNETGYKEIKYYVNSKPRKCIMCNETATVISLETNEPLCNDCRSINDEARKRHK
jgi:hypothetical protein